MCREAGVVVASAGGSTEEKKTRGPTKTRSAIAFDCFTVCCEAVTGFPSSFSLPGLAPRVSMAGPWCQNVWCVFHFFVVFLDTTRRRGSGLIEDGRARQERKTKNAESQAHRAGLGCSSSLSSVLFMVSVCVCLLRGGGRPIAHFLVYIVNLGACSSLPFPSPSLLSLLSEGRISRAASHLLAFPALRAAAPTAPQPRASTTPSTPWHLRRP